jgi:long-chain acyl-CoA synthetase
MTNFFVRVAGAADRHADRVAVERHGPGAAESWTYQRLIAEATRAACWLSASGASRGDRVALLAANDPRWVAAYLGILRIGAIAVPLDTAYTPAQVATILADCGARLLVASPRLAPETSARPLPCRVALLTIDATDESIWSRTAGADAAPPPAAVTRDDPAVVLYTSGTTADPKGVVLTHGNLDSERTAVLAVVTADERDVVLGVLPLFHALAQMANLWVPLSIGARVVFLEQVSSATLLEALQSRGITILACVPQFFYLIHQRVLREAAGRGGAARRLMRALVTLNVRLRDWTGWNAGRRLFARVHDALGPHMRLLITGGSRFDPVVARDLYGFGLSVLNGYGLTETSGAATIGRPGDRFHTSVGQPLPGVEIRIAPPVDGTQRDRDDGEVLVRGSVVMQGYWGRPDATAAALHDGWLHTGDLGRIDDNGRLHITGRQKEMIVLSSGKNIYPEEIEAHYGQSPFIRELGVVAICRPGEPLAERLHALVVPDAAALAQKGIVNVRELIRFELETLAVQLPAHKRLLSYDVALDALPRTTTGKLKRREIEILVRARAAGTTPQRPPGDDERSWLAEPAHRRLIAIVEQQIGGRSVAPDDNLELTLGLDSMERVELLTRLEQAERTRVAPDVRARLFTVRQLVEAVRAAPADSTSSGAGATPAPAWEAILAESADPALTRELRRAKTVRAKLIHTALQVAALLLRVRIDLRVTGREHVPAAAPFIVCPNHQTFFDGFVVAAALPFRAFRRIFFVGAAEFFESRGMAWGARAINIVPLDPDANLVSAMRAAATGLRLGKMLILFPEGERTIDGTIKPFRKGASILASHLQVPVLPVAIDGLYPLWPRGRRFQWGALLSRHRPRVTVAFGAPVLVDGADYAAATSRIEAAVRDAAGRHGPTPSC